jgi:hypothetical protein
MSIFSFLRGGLAVACVATGLTGCSPKYYVPNTQNVPMIRAKGQGSLLVAGNGNQVEAQGAYGVGNAVAIQVNAGLVVPKDEDNGNGGRGKLIEAGIGYFRGNTEGVLFDVYALAGFGTVENHFPTSVPANAGTTGEISADVVRLAIQPSLSLRKGFFSVSGSARLAHLSYKNVTGSLIFDRVDQVQYLTDNDSHVLLEPALTVRAGGRKVRLQVQVARSINVSTSSFPQDESLLTAGVAFGDR